jgi:glucose-1-phosphate cytidylyltransferase
MLNKVIILAGGLGTRLSEETSTRPKPMVEIAGIPILLHIMRIFQAQINCEFFIATGYKSEMISGYLSGNEFLREQIKARAIYTGDETATAGRVKKVMELYPNEPFLLTYGDGVANINLRSLLEFHKAHKKVATVTAVRPAARYGRLEISQGLVTRFAEKPQAEEGWINGGFFVLEPEVKGYIDGPMEMFEREPMLRITAKSQLMGFKHYGFWQPMDTLREKIELEKLASLEKVPWMVFDF